MLDNREPPRSLGWYIPCYLPVYVTIKGHRRLTSGFPIPGPNKGDSTELYAGLLNGYGLTVLLVWREQWIGIAGSDPTGQRWVKPIDGPPRLVDCFRAGAHQLLSEHIAARLNGITLDDDWQTGEALNGRR